MYVAIRKFRVGHDRGRVGIHQNDAVPFLLEGLAGLHAGIVELAALPDDDGAGADDEDALDIRAFGHNFRVSNTSRRENRVPASRRPSGDVRKPLATGPSRSR